MNSILEKLLINKLLKSKHSSSYIAKEIVDFYKKYEKELDIKINEVINDKSFPKEEVYNKFFKEDFSLKKTI